MSVWVLWLLFYVVVVPAIVLTGLWQAYPNAMNDIAGGLVALLWWRWQQRRWNDEDD